MDGLESGMLVQHASLGLGKVVAVEPTAVHVVFVSQSARVATKLRLPTALPFLGPPASSNAWLSGLSGFTLDAKTGRYGRATTWLSHADAVALFREAFPLGLEDPTFLAAEKGPGERAARWRRGHAAYVAALGDGQGERLLAAGDVAGLVERTLKIRRIVSPNVREGVKTPFEAGRIEPALARGFFAALFDLLSAGEPGPAAFEALAASVAALAPPGATPEAAWPVLTLLPFVARPDVHVLLRPDFVCNGAQRLGLELAYEAAPTWATYASLLAATRQLLEKLRPLGARDQVDVEAFMHVLLAHPVRPKAQPRAKAGAARASAVEDAALDEAALEEAALEEGDEDAGSDSVAEDDAEA